MNNQNNYFLKIIILFIVVMVGGTCGYYFIEDGWSFIDAFYMTAISITTVGYSEVKPLSDEGRLFTVLLLFIGLGAAAVFAAQLAKTFLENHFTDYLGEKKMQKTISKLQNHYIICGFGDIGSSICATLYEADIQFVVIEADEENLKYAARRNYLTVKGKATYDTSLYQAGIKKAAGMVISLGEDSLNMYVALAARELNPDLYIIVRGYKAHIEKRMIRAGADIVVYPLKMGGEQMARLIISQTGKDSDFKHIEVGQSSIMGCTMRVYRHFEDQPLSVGRVLEKTNASSALLLRKGSGEEHENIHNDMTLDKNDSLLLLVREGSARQDNIPYDDHDLFNWSEDYESGIASIDEEHRKLFELSNDFVLALNNKLSKENLAATFDTLIEYTCFHFENEEKMLAKQKYPDLEQHKKEHEQLTNKVLELNSSRNYVFSDNVADFLYSWLRNHILESDMKYARYLLKKK